MSKTDNRTSEEKVAALIRETVEKEMSRLPQDSITREELYALERKDRRAGRRKIVRYAGIAAAVLVVFAAAVYFTCSTLFPPAKAEKSEKKVEKQQEDTIVIEGEEGNWGVGEDDKMVTKEWAYVEQYKKKHPDLLVPAYIPKGYKFVQLTRKKVDKKKFLSEFIFEDKEGISFLITQRTDHGGTARFIERNDEIIIIDEEKAFIEKGRQAIIVSLIRGDQIITLNGHKNFPIEEMKKVIHGLK